MEEELLDLLERLLSITEDLVKDTSVCPEWHEISAKAADFREELE